MLSLSAEVLTHVEIMALDVLFELNSSAPPATKKRGLTTFAWY